MALSYDPNDEHAYQRARRLGVKASHAAMQKGENPYLPVLDEIVPDHLSLTRVNLGVITVPTEHVVGTGTRGRTSAFACNFMPLLDEDSEFALKWALLYHSVAEDGIREPVKVLEYMNRFYALEGNKRISVAKFLGSPLMEVDAVRIMPKRADDHKTRLYFEYLDFYRDTGINCVEFSEEGSYRRIYEYLGREPGVRWTAEERADFMAVYYRFSEAFQLMGGDLLNMTVGDALLMYLQVYGYRRESFEVASEIRSNLNRLRGEFNAMSQRESISLVMSSSEGQRPGLIQQIRHVIPQPKVRAAFLYNRSPEVSGWTYWHQLGCNHLQTAFGSRVETRSVSNVTAEDCRETVESLIREGSNVIFATSPVLLDGAMQAALAHPEVKILNCSLLPEYQRVRSYYLRMYEAKYVIGAIAGAMADNNRIGYIADYPVYGIPASINAFALGARMTNPRAQVFLEWSTIKGGEPEKALVDQGVRIISNRDISAPSHQSLEFGLYDLDDGDTRNLAMPIWNWGKLYEELIRRIQSGVWETDNPDKVLNYWWGMDTGAIDVFYSHKLDAGVRRLADLLRSGIRDGSFRPFSETIISQDGEHRCHSGHALTPAEIIAMDYLADNVVGRIPGLDEMKPEALPFVRVQGLKAIKAPEISEIAWTGADSDGE